jgi:diguanylate cyclase (GGDEF)-like protein
MATSNDARSASGSPPPRRRSGFGVTTRLIALVMLPVTVMCGVAGSVVWAHRSTATRALAVEHGVAKLSELLELRDALHTLHAVQAFDVRFLQLGVTRDLAVSFIGVDWAPRVAPARAKADRAIASLGEDSPITADALSSLYADIDNGTIDVTLAAQRLNDFGKSISAAVTRDLDRLTLEAGNAPLDAALESVRAASGLVDVVTPQVIDLSAIWFPSPADTPQTTAAAVARLGAERTGYLHGVDDLRHLDVKSVVAALVAIEFDPRIQAFDHAVSTTVLGEPLTAAGATLDLDKVAQTFRGHLILASLLDDLVTTATSAVHAQAQHVATSEEASFVTWAAVAAILSLIFVGTALRLAQSISKPLKNLAAYAHAVNEGHLDAQPSPGHNRGPRETRVAFGVFTDLVTNLQLLDAKANALAHCDFENPVLREPLPGRLGRSLESSVALLSGSIVERDQLQTNLAHQATHDSLTGIYNRPAAITGIQAAMNRADRTAATTAVLFFDLNEFKAVNDSHGHEVGDEVLRQIADRMTVGLRSGDFAARLGGDEFVVVAEAITDVADATDLARRIIDTITMPITVGALNISIGAAVGVALTLDGPEDPLRLLARADAAMYRAKQHDHSAIEIFDAELQQQMVEREDIETALTAALIATANNELKLHYQPVLDAASGAMVSAEALIRWDRPGHGRLPPDSFIPIAEATALIIDIDCWVLAEATRQLVAWSSVADLAEMPVSVNISGRHLLSRQLPEHIRAALDQSGVDPHRLTIEITETVLLTDLVAVAAELDEVRALGVRVAIDDFGTGYTSLAHLQHLPIDIIKIDRSFVSQLNVRRGSSLVRMVTDLGHAIDLSIVAEGVETSDELAALQAMGADCLQGFLLSRPLTPEAFIVWAHEHVSGDWQRAATAV